jgi:uncharacterized protein YneF (UPF0154 family)
MSISLTIFIGISCLIIGFIIGVVYTTHLQTKEIIEDGWVNED